MKFLTVIIPAHNCRNEIERLLDSIVIQNWDKNELSVVICDDNSTDNFMELVEPYNEKLDIIYRKTKPRDIHCPGNTRKDGLEYVDSAWVTFIDNDDAFEPGAFDAFRDAILQHGETRFLFSKFREYIEEKDEYGANDFTGMTWLHGNFYNVKFLKENNIDFKEDLESHEDLYFNSLVTAELVGNNLRYTSIPQYCYKWIYRPNSCSRAFFNEKHYYIDIYLGDYLYAATYPWLEAFKKYPQSADFFYTQAVYAILYGYFYYEASVYRNGHDEVTQENFKKLQSLLKDILEAFNIRKEEIISKVYSDPHNYDRVKKESYNGAGIFVELESFRNFVLSL